MPEPPWGEAIKPGFPSMGCSGFFAVAGQVLSVLKNVFLAPGLQIVIELCWTGYALRSVRRLGRRAKRGQWFAVGGPYYNRASHSKNGKWMPDFEIRRSEFKRFRFLDHKTFFGRRCIKKERFIVKLNATK
ncbi:MAG: hypothetical protein C6P37_12015 [Caldibacillus debilis]|uniref:Uncharacterized protein n=1 Tax=Caldibacillus debilis TaxID=301148 RepID=A0A3E0K397_9BACI|nr:hypothetical protein [Caldibacillus debilis]REJ27189.1 MAG: hypothetical protein C6P37_12015 [Caldibacillus debilis]REJ28215.1 MAG: hypothetical protein C6W56_08585 [Caldibacillus debilis]